MGADRGVGVDLPGVLIGQNGKFERIGTKKQHPYQAVRSPIPSGFPAS